jgi:hypothetical protein
MRVTFWRRAMGLHHVGNLEQVFEALALELRHRQQVRPAFGGNALAQGAVVRAGGRLRLALQDLGDELADHLGHGPATRRSRLAAARCRVPRRRTPRRSENASRVRLRRRMASRRMSCCWLMGRKYTPCVRISRGNLRLAYIFR